MVHKSSGKVNLGRVVGSAGLGASSVSVYLSNGKKLDDVVEEVLVDGKSVMFDLGLPWKLADITKPTAKDEAIIAEALYNALIPARQVSPKLLRDQEVWTWIGLVPLRDYVVNRWCDGYSPSGGVYKAGGCSYFLTGDALVSQARCGARRLWIAASTSFRADGDNRHILNFLKRTDLYTGIFERMVGLDAELAAEIAGQSVDETEKIRRDTVRMVGQVLSTTVLESLDRKSKAVLVADCLSEVKGLP